MMIFSIRVQVELKAMGSDCTNINRMQDAHYLDTWNIIMSAVVFVQDNWNIILLSKQENFTQKKADSEAFKRCQACT